MRDFSDPFVVDRYPLPGDYLSNEGDLAVWVKAIDAGSEYQTAGIDTVNSDLKVVNLLTGDEIAGEKYFEVNEDTVTIFFSIDNEEDLTERLEKEREYEEITVKLALSNEYIRKLEILIGTKRIFSSRAEAFRRALELLFEKYEREIS